MKKNRLYSLSVLVIGVLISVSLLPLRIYAQSLTSPFLGINVQVTSIDSTVGSITFPKVAIDYVGSSVPSGYISGQLNCTTPSSPSSSTPCDVFSFQNTSGQSGTGNGTRIYLNLQNYLLEFNGNASVTASSKYVVDYEFVLDDNYKGSVTFDDGTNSNTVFVNGKEFHYSYVQNSQSELTMNISSYDLVRVYDSIMWNFPIESFPFVANFLDPNGGFKIVDYPVIGKWTFPMFRTQNSSQNLLISTKVVYPESAITDDRTDITTIIFITNISSINDIENAFSWSSSPSGAYLYKKNRLTTFRLPDPDSNTYTTWGMFKLQFKTTTTCNLNLYAKKSPFYIVPIYNGWGRYISTDFADQFGLLGYRESSDQAQDMKSEFDTDSNDLITIEDTFNDSMNSALQNVSPSFNMGQSFLNSANWVSTQFNNLVNNTPFASLITFGLTLGLGLLIIGKIRK